MLQKKRDLTQCGNYSSISLVLHAGRVLVRLIATPLIEYCERGAILPQEQSGFCPNRSTVDMTFVVRQLYTVVQRKNTSLYAYSIDPTKAYDSVHRDMLRSLLILFGVPPKKLQIIGQFHDMCESARTERR